MTGDVVEFVKREPMWWRCNCGCLTFYVRDDGELECAICETVQDSDGSWRRPPKDAPMDDGEGDDISTKVHADPAFNFRRFVDRAMAQEFNFLIGIKNNGEVSTVGELLKTRAHRGWIRRRLERARQMLVEWK